MNMLLALSLPSTSPHTRPATVASSPPAVTPRRGGRPGSLSSAASSSMTPWSSSLARSSIFSHMKWLGASAGSRGSTDSCGKLVAGPSREFTEVMTLPESCRLAKAPNPGEPAESAPRDSGGAPGRAGR